MRNPFVVRPGERPHPVQAVVSYLVVCALIVGFFWVSLVQVGVALDFSFIGQYQTRILDGLLLTLQIAVGSLVVSLVIGLPVAVGQGSRVLPVRYLCDVYVKLMRGTPLLAQIYLFFYIVGTAWGVENRLVAGIIILSIFSGAYIAEIVRGSLTSLDAGQLEAARGGDVLHMELGARELGQHDVALDLQLLALGRPAQKAQARGGHAFVDLALAHQALVLAVTHEHLAEHLAVVHAAAHHAGRLYAAPVVSEGHGAGGDHVAHVRERLALKALGHGARRIHMAAPHLLGTALDIGHHGARIGYGVGVGHGAHAREAALRGRARLGLDVALVLVTGIAQMDVHVHQARHQVRAGKVDNLGARRLEVLAHLGDLIAVDQHVGNAVDPDLRVDDMGSLKQIGHCRHLPAEDRGRPCARRCPRTPGPR